MNVGGLYEIHLPVRDLARSVAFYRDVVGLLPAWSDAGRGLAFLWVGGRERGMLGLWQADRMGSSPLRYTGLPTLHFALSASLPDVLSAPDHLRSKGVQPLGFDGEPVDEPVVIGWMPAAAVYFKDPDGHTGETIALLDEAPDAGFGIGPYAAWAARG